MKTLKKEKRKKKRKKKEKRGVRRPQRYRLRIEIAFPFFQSQRNRQSERRVYEGSCLLEKKWKTKSVDGAGRVLLVVADAGAILLKLDPCPER